MIEYEKIGQRIAEERKLVHRISQRKMAEDLFMYQADISNLEKAKSGSGITDLSKLDLIADYFKIPVKTLIFGREDENTMLVYTGKKMLLTADNGEIPETQLKTLMNLMGEHADPKGDNGFSYKCGPYTLRSFLELQIPFGGGTNSNTPEDKYALNKLHTFLFYYDEIAAVMVANVASVMDHVYQPIFQKLSSMIQPEIFDLSDTLTILNPYWLLYQFAEGKETKTLRKKMFKRMDALRQAGEGRIITYVESAYVREDFRRHGLFRMYIDYLREVYPGCITWLNLEPTSGEEMDTEYSYFPSYEISDVGQLSQNAVIAEKLGFEIDPKTWTISKTIPADDGTTKIEPAEVRKCAYYLPSEIKDIIKNDGDLVARARALRKLVDDGEEISRIVDVYQGAWKKYGYIFAIKMKFRDETVYAFTRGFKWEDRWFGVSYKNPAKTGEDVPTIESFSTLEEATDSKYYEGLKQAERLYGCIFFQTVASEDAITEFYGGKGLKTV